MFPHLKVPTRCANTGKAATRRDYEEDVMQRYQNSIISGDIKAIVADANAALRRLGISAAVLARPEIQAQLGQAIAGMGAISQYGVDITVTVEGGAQ